MPHQRHIVDVAFELDPATGLLVYSQVIVIGPRQATGKALDATTPMLTTRGWVPLSEVEVGDEVYHPSGHSTRVLFATEEVTGHDCYRVTTSDGRTVVADADHLWTVKDTFTGTRVWKTLTTAQLAEAGLRNRGAGGYRWRLPIQRAVKSPDVDLPIDPYFLGLWLGDGTTANSSITVGDQDLQHVREQIAACGLTMHSEKQDGRTGVWALWISSPRRIRRCIVAGCTRLVVSRGLCGPDYNKLARSGELPPLLPMDSLNTRLRNLGVLGNKHVPDAYLNAGHDQRLALLQGLMDSDGSIEDRQGSVEFCSTLKPLAEAVLYLARSLGWRAFINEGNAKLYGHVTSRRWRVTWSPRTDGLVPFRLPRKLARMLPASTRSAESVRSVSIAGVERVASRPVRCIKVDSPDGLFLAGRDLVATHNTELLLPVMTHRCTGFDANLVKWIRERLGVRVPLPGPQRVLYTAQTAEDARKKWRDVHFERLERSSYGRPRPRYTARLRQTAELLKWDNGSTWLPGSTTGKTGGTGDTLDLGVIDEAWSRPDARTELGMRPAQMTRPWRQQWIASMIPGLSRARPDEWPYLKRKRELGRELVTAGVRDGTAFFDFCAPPDADPADPATWYAAMPGLGRIVPERAVAEDFGDMDLVDFCAEYLGWEPAVSTPKWTLIPRQVWEDRRDPGSVIEGAAALAVEMNEARNRAWITAAGYRFDDNYHVEVVEPGYKIPVGVDMSPDLVEARLVELWERQSPCTVVIDPRRPAVSLIVPLRNRGIDVLTPNQPEIAGACGRFYDATGAERVTTEDDMAAEDDGRRLFHLGQDELDRALSHARRLDLGAGQFTFVKKGAASELGPLYGVTLALHGLMVKGGRDYDLLDSIDESRPCHCGRYIYPDAGGWRHADDESPACRG